MNFAARRNTLEAKLKVLAGTMSTARRSVLVRQFRPRCGERLENFKMDELRQVEVALARLSEGSYGFCQICGDDIPDDRLDQFPATPFCQFCVD